MVNVNVMAKTFLIICLAVVTGNPPKQIKIGALFSDSSDDDGVVLSFQLAVDFINNHPSVLPRTNLTFVYNRTKGLLTTFENIQSVCRQMEQGVSVIIGPASSTAVKATHPVSAGLHIPQVAPFATDPLLSVDASEYPYLLKMSAPDSFQGRAITDMIRWFGWTRLAILASMTDYGRNGIQEVIQQAATEKWIISAIEYFHPSANVTSLDVTSQLINIKKSGARVIITNCLAPYGKKILEQANVFDMTSKGWAWVVTDGITSINGLYNPCAEVPLHIRGLIGTRPAYGRGSLYRQFEELWKNSSGAKIGAQLEELPILYPSPYVMRTFDAVLVTAHALHALLEDNQTLTGPHFTTGVCTANNLSPWTDGNKLYRYMKQVSTDGVMNFLNFTSLNYPGFTEYEIVNLRETGWVKVGDWSPVRPNKLEIPDGTSITFPGDTASVPRDTSDDLKNVTFKIVTIVEEPFFMPLQDDEPIICGNLPYKGYCVDLICELQKGLGFNFDLHVVHDGNYGGRIPSTGQWNGMVGEIIRGEADMALAPLTISYDRQQSVDFTAPFMDLGLTILMARETPTKDVLAFLQPFERELWCAVFGAFVLCGVATTACSYLSPYGYHGRFSQRFDRRKTRHEADKDALNLYNGLWLSYASWMQQGTDRSPISFSGRFLHGVWWFFVMVISATYTANLAAFLTVARLDTGIKSVMDLANQQEILYGTVSNSAPRDFFAKQAINPYKKMYNFMTSENTFVPNVSEGIKRVQESHGKPKGERFAFIFDSTIMDYISKNEPCKTMTVGRLFNQFGYGVAFKKNSPYVKRVSLEILKLRSSGYLEGLQSKWLSGPCREVQDSSASTKGESASLTSMSGVFFMLFIGIGATLIALVTEYIVASCRDSRRRLEEEGVEMPFNEALCRRLHYVSRDLQHTFCRFCIPGMRKRSPNRRSHHTWRKKRPASRDVRSERDLDETRSNSNHVGENNHISPVDPNDIQLNPDSHLNGFTIYKPHDSADPVKRNPIYDDTL